MSIQGSHRLARRGRRAANLRAGYGSDNARPPTSIGRDFHGKSRPPCVESMSA
jgi:hypothetical protein